MPDGVTVDVVLGIGDAEGPTPCPTWIEHTAVLEAPGLG
jgi:hypothetical protein